MGSQCTTLLQGPLEVFSSEAMQLAADGFERCRLKDIWMSSVAEDRFMETCMHRVGAIAWKEPHLVKARSPMEECGANAPAFHPYKDVESYADCLFSATSKEALHTMQGAAAHAGQPVRQRSS